MPSDEGRGLSGHFPGCPRYERGDLYAVDHCDCGQRRDAGEVPPEPMSRRVLSVNDTVTEGDWCYCPKATRRHFVTVRCWPRVSESVMDNAACSCPIVPVQHRATVYCNQEAPDA